MINLYQGTDGVFATADALTPDEAVDMYERNALAACDIDRLKPDALAAVLARFGEKVRARGNWAVAGSEYQAKGG